MFCDVFYDDSLDATITPGFDLPPYHVESFRSGWHCVCNRNGFNVLHYPNGRVFTSLENAKILCDRFNAEYKLNRT